VIHLKKIGLLVFMLLMMMFVIAGCGSSNSSNESNGTTPVNADASQETYEIGIAHTIADTGATHLALLKFKELVEKNSDGRISVDIYPNGMLYTSERAAIEAVQAGNIQMTVTASAPVVGFVPEFKVLDLPFLFADHETAYEALDGELGQKLLELLPAKGLRGIVYGETGMRQITNSKRPIEKPEDLKDLKIRTMENDVHISAFNTFGANAQPFAFGELYTALQQNTFDSMENPINLIDQMKFYEVQDYLTISNHAYTATILFMNDDLYNSLPDDLRKIIEDAAVEYRDYQRQLAQEQDNSGLKVIEGEMEINTLTEEQIKLFVDASEPVYEKFKADIGQDMLDLARSYNK
jgi:tripartite ATP-independent transporter DctP family solute receptor